MNRSHDGVEVGQAGFTGPPNPEGWVELAYGIRPEYQGNGYATEAAQALVGFALDHDNVSVVRAHTLPEPSASTAVLTKCGFKKILEIHHPVDGRIWVWELGRAPHRPGL